MRMRTHLILAAAATMALTLGACERHEGPAEKAGNAVDRAGQKVHDAVDPPAGPASAVGRKIDRATGD